MFSISASDKHSTYAFLGTTAYALSLNRKRSLVPVPQKPVEDLREPVTAYEEKPVTSLGELEESETLDPVWLSEYLASISGTIQELDDWLINRGTFTDSIFLTSSKI